VTAEVPGLALLAAALAVWPAADAPVRARLRRLGGSPQRRGRSAAGGAGPRAERRVPRPLLPAAVGVATALGAGGTTGLLLGVLSAGAAAWLLHRARGSGDGGAGAPGELPVACDLLAVCLAAGVPVGTALDGVGRSVADPLRAELLRVAAMYRLGAEPAHAWAGAPAVLAPLARALARAGTSGSAVGAALRALAGDVRAAQRARGEAAVRRAGVWVLAPLGACFLPAFVCLGVVPLVLGLAAGVLG
jgi:pilus assembly protein TadC